MVFLDLAYALEVRGLQLGVVRRKLGVVRRFNVVRSEAVQLSVVTEKLNVVTDGPPGKGRRYHTFTHTNAHLT